MRIEAVDFFYLAMPEITTEADGSQDALLVRVAAGGHTGWGECEASPLVSIAGFVCPMSHGVCRPVGASVLGEGLDGPADIRRIAARVAYDSMDLLQAPHTFSGVEMALWDVLGKFRQAPVWRLLGYARSCKKLPYASQLFGDTPEATLQGARDAIAAGFAAVKFGWGPIGRADTAPELRPFRGGAGRAWAGMPYCWSTSARFGVRTWRRRPRACRPFKPRAQPGSKSRSTPRPSRPMAALRSAPARRVKLAGGEGAHNIAMAQHLMEYGAVGFIQIDCGRIGGIGPAKAVADEAVARGITFVNHTFTSHLALSASLQPFAGLSDHRLCEYPFAPSKLASELTANHLTRDADGEVAAPDAPGLGITIDIEAARRYLQQAEIKVNGRVLYATPILS